MVQWLSNLSFCLQRVKLPKQLIEELQHKTPACFVREVEGERSFKVKPSHQPLNPQGGLPTTKDPCRVLQQSGSHLLGKVGFSGALAATRKFGCNSYRNLRVALFPTRRVTGVCRPPSLSYCSP